MPPGTKHGTVQRLRGEGPAIPGGSGKGDLRYRFVIDVPGELSDEQRRAVDELSKVMNGNPRERILRDGEAGLMARPPDPRSRRSVDADRGVFMISVAAELADMHPQTLRMYEARGLIEPQALAEGHAPVLARRRRAAAPDPGADLRRRA